jgi:hypothetical protein
LFIRERNRDAEGVIASSPSQNPLIIPTMLAGHCDTIGAFVTSLAVPLPPIAALAAYPTMPGATILYYAVPAKGIPVASTTFRTKVHAQELFQRYTLVPTGQIVGCLQLSLSEGLARFDVLDRAGGQAFDIDPIQRILTIRAATTIVTRLVVLKTSASVGTATCLAVAVVFLFHNHAPW